MRRCLVCASIALLLAGCKSAGMDTSGLFGRTTVPPPATGSAGQAVPDPFQPAAPQAAPSTNGGYMPPGQSYQSGQNTAPATQGTTTAAGLEPFNPNGAARTTTAPATTARAPSSADMHPTSRMRAADQSDADAAWRSPSASTQGGADFVNSQTPAAQGDGSVLRIMRPPGSNQPDNSVRVGADASALAASEHWRESVPAGTQRITDRSVRPASAVVDQSGNVISTDSGYRPSDTAALRTVRRNSAETETAPEGAYGHGQDYSWLKGRLEYSEADDQWSIRFAPDGTQDRFGGRAILGDTSALEDYEPGDYVAVQGAMRQARNAPERSAGWFDIERIKPL